MLKNSVDPEVCRRESCLYDFDKINSREVKSFNSS